MMDNMESGGSSDKESKGVEVELTDAQKRQLDNAVKKQKEFLNGETKNKVSYLKKILRLSRLWKRLVLLKKLLVRVLKLSMITELIVTKRGTKVIVIKKLTKDMIEEEMFPSVLTNSHCVQKSMMLIFLVVFNLVLNLVRNYKFVVSHVRLSGQDLIVDVLIRD